MTTQASVTIYVAVHDPDALLKAALQRALKDGMPEAAAREMLTAETSEGTRDPDIAACLRMLADPGESWPGTEIQDSSADDEGEFLDADRAIGV